MNSMQHLPLKKGGRPAMGGRSWLQHLHLHHASGRSGWGLSALDGLAASMALQGMAQCLRQLPTLDPHAFLRNGWEDLPLMLQPEMVRRWERERPWAGWNLHNQWTDAYQALLEGPQPSDAYAPHEAHGHVVSQIWQAYFEKAPRLEICQMLEDSAQDWQEWFDRHPDKATSQQGYLGNLVSRLEALGLTGKQAHLLALLETFWLGLEQHFPKTGELMFRWFGEEASQWLSISASAVGAPVQDVLELFHPSSRLIQLELYRDVSRAAWLREKETGLKRFRTFRHSKWSEALGGWLKIGLLPWITSHQSPASSEEELAVMSKRWEFLGGEFEEAVAALKADRPVSILVLGEHGHGKTQLGLDLVVAAGRFPVEVSAEGAADANLEAMAHASWQARTVERGIVVVDDASGVFDAPSMGAWMGRARQEVSLLATATQLKSFDSKARERFDKIIWLDAMPLGARIHLARQHFPTPELALRVARSLKTPKAIVDAASWCQKANSWSWSTIKAHRIASDRAAERTGWDARAPDFEVEAPVRPEDLPPMAGNDHLKELANRLTIAFENPEKFARLGATPPKGAVLVGPPGTGKTLFARHLAARLQVPLLTPDPAKLFEKPERISVLFQAARDNAPCVILMDEAEKLICQSPLGLPPPSALGSLLTEIEGVSSLEGVLLIATTNNANIYPALLRSGRLSELREVLEPLPKDREAIWSAYLKDRPLEATARPLEEWVQVLSKASRGFTGADIAEVLRRCAGDTVAAGQTELSLSGLVRSCDAVRWTAPNGRDPLSAAERRQVAIHEAGHALLSWRWGLDVLCITVRARQNALGMVQWMPPEQTNDQSRRRLYGKTQMVLGGIAAEQALLGEYAGGGSSDLAHARKMLEFAFARSGLGSMGPMAASESVDKWPEFLRQQLEEEIRAWSQSAFEEAVAWLKTHQALVETLADQLLAMGDLSGEELEEHQQRALAVAALPPVPDPMPWGGSSSHSPRLVSPPATAAPEHPTLHQGSDSVSQEG